jgi:Flp pilus assembly protein TadD
VSVGKEKARTGDYRAALEKFREAVQLAPENPQAHYQLALALQHLGKTVEARTHFAEAKRLAPRLHATQTSKP